MRLIRCFWRSLLAGVFFACYGIGSLAIGGILFPPIVLLRMIFNAPESGSAWRLSVVKGLNKLMRRLIRLSWKLFVWGGRVTGLFIVHISEEDKSRLAKTHGAVVVANHLTLIDVVVLSVFLPDATAIAKAAARKNFFYSLIVRGVFLVNDDPMRVMEEAKSCLADGVNLIVFPQGTRTPNGVGTPLRRGAAQIAIHAGVPIVPVVISCDPPVLAKDQAWYDVADRTVVWTLRVCDEITVPPATTTFTHATAVALTEMIRTQIVCPVT